MFSFNKSRDITGDDFFFNFYVIISIYYEIDYERYSFPVIFLISLSPLFLFAPVSLSPLFLFILSHTHTPTFSECIYYYIYSKFEIF